MKNYFYITPTRDGWQNLAIDEYLLNTLKADELCLLIYVNENAVIMGKNQNPWAECDLEKMREDSVQLVRRCTGGGAVYHDNGNLNYSFIAHKDRYDEERQTQLILDTLKDFGINGERSGRNDLTVDGRKFSGTAFCSRGENRQHHGTLLIDANMTKLGNYLTAAPQKLESKGIKSVRSRVVNLKEITPTLRPETVIKAIYEKFRVEYGEFEELRLGNKSLEEVAELYERNRSWAWQLGKTPSFDYTYENRFPWGMARLCLNVENGVIAEVRLYTDALDVELPERIESRLLGRKFDSEEAVRLLEEQ